ncbi:MAG TPA: GH3 auxin-responsive promoter family protein [Salinimicrobium sp.]|nr:GH3 auxin-responsive promoter family protein [Salinimicrobium sp.]
MAIIGSLIKGVIDLSGSLSGEKNPIKTQENQLRNLLDRARNTAFGKHYNFEEILASDDVMKSFSETVPFFDYNKINSEWWYKMHEGEDDVTWPGKPPYFARSSGTTGKSSKRIPVTDEMIESIRQTGLKQVASLKNYDLPSDFFEKEIMMLGSSTFLNQKKDHQEGEISGISASQIPFWFRNFYKPGKEIAQIEDWDERVLAIAKEAPNWDIGALTGIPSWIELMMKKVIEYHNLKNIHEIWPNLRVFSSGGVAFETYEKSFNELLAHPITIIDTYLASEGFLAFQSRPETTAMKLVLDNGIYFEFVPFKQKYINEDGSLKQDSPIVSMAEVKADEDYVLVISTVSGAWRYIIGDTIKFTDVERKEIKITGRTKFFMNVLGEQLSVNKMTDAVRDLEDQFNITIPEFTISAIKKPDGFYHKWYLGVEGEADDQSLAAALDAFLKQYRSFRSARGKALKGVEVVSIPPNVFYEWSGMNKKKGGQVKMEKMMQQEKFEEWEKFVESQVQKS